MDITGLFLAPPEDPEEKLAMVFIAMVTLHSLKARIGVTARDLLEELAACRAALPPEMHPVLDRAAALVPR